MNAGTVSGRDPSQQYSEVHPKQSFSGNLHLDPTTCLAVPRAPILNPGKFSCSATRRDSRVQNRCDSAAPALGASLGHWAHDGRIRSRSFGAGASSGADRPSSRQELLVCCCYPLASRRQPTSLLACPGWTLPVKKRLLDRTRKLRRRQRRIVALVAQGLKNRDIAVQLGIGAHVVRNYISTIYDKIGVSNRVELALWYEARKYEGRLLV